MDTRNLPVQLGQEELDQRRDRLAYLFHQIEEAEYAKSAAGKAAKEAIDKLSEEASQVAREIRSKSEYRDVKVEQSRNVDRKLMETVRLDTGEVVDSRALSQIELQGKLFAVGDG